MDPIIHHTSDKWPGSPAVETTTSEGSAAVDVVYASNASRQKRRRWSYYGGAVVLVVLAVTVVVLLVGKNDDNNYTGSSASPEGGVQGNGVDSNDFPENEEASDEEFPAPESPFQDLLMSLSRTNGKEFNDNGSYQSRAWYWLTKEEEGSDSSMSDQRLVQRYAMACLFYSTHEVPNDYTKEVLAHLGLMPWNHVDGWMSGKSECLWYGVECDDSGWVVRLDLQKNALTGSIPFELSYLGDSLKVLLLDTNFFHNKGSEGHAFLEGLTRLTNFSAQDTYLQHNGLPTQFAAMTSLQSLDVAYVVYAGGIADASVWKPLTMVDLLYVDIRGNRFHSPIPTNFVNQPSIKAFYAGNSDVTGKVNKLLPYLQQAEEIWLDENPELEGTLPTDIDKLTALKSLSVTETGLKGAIPPAMGNMVDLEQVWLYKNSLTGTVPETLGNLKLLRLLALYGNNMENSAIPTSLCDNTRDKLKILSVDCAIECTCCTCCGEECGKQNRESVRRLEHRPRKKRWI